MNEMHVNRTLEVRHLRMMDAVTRHGTVTRAAADLNLTQPALSHQLRDLEDRLGVPLFERQARRMVPTAAGERLAAAARRLLDDLSAAEAEVRQAERQPVVPLRISTGCYTCYHWLPSRLIEMRRRFPHVEIHVAADYTRRPIEGLLEGAVDLAIVSDPVKHAGLWSEPLFSDDVLLVVSADHPLAGSDHVAPTALADQTLIVYNAPLDQLSLFRDLLRPAGVRPRETIQIELTEAIVEMVRAGLGVTCLARWAVTPYLLAGGLVTVRLTRRGYRRQWRAAMRRRERAAPHLQALVQLLRDRPL